MMSDDDHDHVMMRRCEKIYIRRKATSPIFFFNPFCYFLFVIIILLIFFLSFNLGVKFSKANVQIH